MKNSQKIFAISVAIIIIILMSYSHVQAKAKLGDWNKQLSDVNSANESDLYRDDRTKTAEEQIAVYMGILVGWTTLSAIPIMIHMLLGAYEWMTAKGNSEKIDKAKLRIRNALMGSFIVMFLYIIAYFFITYLSKATDYTITG